MNLTNEKPIWSEVPMPRRYHVTTDFETDGYTTIEVTSKRQKCLLAKKDQVAIVFRDNSLKKWAAYINNPLYMGSFYSEEEAKEAVITHL